MRFLSGVSRVPRTLNMHLLNLSHNNHRDKDCLIRRNWNIRYCFESHSGTFSYNSVLIPALKFGFENIFEVTTLFSLICKRKSLEHSMIKIIFSGSSLCCCLSRQCWPIIWAWTFGKTPSAVECTLWISVPVVQYNFNGGNQLDALHHR